ncbi:Mitochondrial translocator assembly and maintenance protein 41 [Thoreauomyces humboldtii]|nr:Mitochondrial translocator assembly and maintenance protein 41 [Thoreauomyces humboldtii]
MIVTALSPRFSAPVFSCARTRVGQVPTASVFVFRRRFAASANAVSTSPPTPADDAHLQAVLSDFHAPVRYAIAYGSGVFKQRGNTQSASSEPPMVDLLFGVTHPEHWHSLNIRQNRHHYSALAAFGSKAVAHVQDSFGAGLYFNPDVQVAGMTIKYGVVAMDKLINDLNHWDTLYLAGRLQKPVKTLRHDARVTIANRRNLRASVRAALLLLPPQFTEEELFCAIASLSYRGDFRMRVGGENPHKVFNIVYSQMAAFRELYRPVIEDLPNVQYIDGEAGSLTQDLDTRLRGQLLQKLPRGLHDKVYKKFGESEKGREVMAAVAAVVQAAPRGTEKLASKDGPPPPMPSATSSLEPQLSQAIAGIPELPQYVDKSLEDIVKWPALTQAFKGILTAGFTRAVVYAKNKIVKALAGKKTPHPSSNAGQ